MALSDTLHNTDLPQLDGEYNHPLGKLVIHVGDRALRISFKPKTKEIPDIESADWYWNQGEKDATEIVYDGTGTEFREGHEPEEEEE